MQQECNHLVPRVDPPAQVAAKVPLTYRNNSGCCVNLFNTSALTEFIAAGNYSLWASCSVETPGFCTQSIVRRPSSGAASTQYPLSKLLTGLLLLGVVMVLML